MAKYKLYEPNQGYFLTIIPSAQFDEYSTERVIDRFVDEQVDIKLFDKNYNNDHKGQRAIHPFAKLKVIFYSYTRGIQSSHQIERMIKEKNIGYVFLSGNTEIDHSTICDFINEFSEEIITILSKLLALLNQLGLIDWGSIMIDGSKISSVACKELTSNAKGFKEKLARYKELSKKLINRAQKINELEAQGLMSSQEYETERKRIERQGNQYNAIIQKIEEYEKEVEEGFQDGNDKINLTDRESVLMKTGDGYVQGYNVQAAFSSNDIIVDIEALSKSNDQGLLEDRINRIESFKEALGVEEKSIYLADKGYCNPKQIMELEQQGKEIYCAIPDSITKNWINDQIYSLERDGKDIYFTCTGGQRKKGYFETKEKAYCFAIKRDSCGDCENISKCWVNREKQNIRKYKISSALCENKEMWKLYVNKMESSEGIGIYNKRLGKEHNFNDLKHHNGLQRILRRGRSKASTDAFLTAIAHNLKKMAQYLGFQQKMILLGS